MEKEKAKKVATKRKPAKKKPAKKVATKEIEKVNSNTSLKKSEPLDISRPQDVMSFGKVLKKYIEENSLAVVIQGSPYAMVDGWKFAGTNFGLTAIPGKPVAKHEKGQYVTTLYVMKEIKKRQGGSYTKEVAVFAGFSDDVHVIEEMRKKFNVSNEITRPYFAYECECDVLRLSDGSRVNYGVGLCSNLELLKSGFDEYSVNSMSQTRAIGKAYRNLLGFVMKAAGMETTPAEEMDEVNKREEDSKFEEPKLPAPSKKQIEGIKKKIVNEGLKLDEIKKYFTLDESLEKELLKLYNLDKPVATEEQFKDLCKKAVAGAITIEQASSEYDLSIDQFESLEAIFKAKK